MKLRLSAFIEHDELAVDRAVGQFPQIGRYLGEELKQLVAFTRLEADALTFPD